MTIVHFVCNQINRQQSTPKMADETPADSVESPSSVVSSSKSLLSLNGEDSETDPNGFAEIYEALGLSGNDEERINLTRFRRIIAENLEVDASFMYKRVFNAFDTQGIGYLTARELVNAISILLQGPFQAQVELGLRVYGRPTNVKVDKQEGNDSKTPKPTPPSAYIITKADAVLSIVESLQLSSPRARHTLTTDNREKAHHIGEDLVFIIFPKLDIDQNGTISLDDFSKACHDDPSLIQVFGQYLPKNNGVLPSSPPIYHSQSSTSLNLNAPEASSSSSSPDETGENIRPRSRRSFEGIDYLRHSPTIGTMWGRQDAVGGLTIGHRKSDRLEPIPMIKPK